MGPVCDMIKKQADSNFVNLRTAILTYDRDAHVCGAPAWRYVYHTIHSADKWFFNPFVYNEPSFHTEGLDNPNFSCDTVLTDEQLLDYLEQVRRKTADYLDSINDSMLNDYPEQCKYSRIELVLMQFRHISVHIGLLNGQTLERTGKFPVYVTPDSLNRLDNGLFEQWSL